MPIRINLLAEQQAAEEAKRRDPIKRAAVMGGAFIVLTLAWALVTFMQVKARRAEFANIDSEFRRLDEKAKVVRNTQTEAGDIERRIISLERYSTNRVLWASMLDALQAATMDQIRLKTIQSNQRYISNAPAVFFTTNVTVPFSTTPPAWKFWASAPKATAPMTLVSNSFKSFFNGPPFSTNKVPYKVKTTVTSTNLVTSEITVKCEFSSPPVLIEDTDVVLSGGDYGNPPGAVIDDFARRITALPYFTARLSSGDERARFMERPPVAEPDQNLPNSPLHKRFSLRLKYADRILTNE